VQGPWRPELAILRQIALNLLKQETTCKFGTSNKRLKAAWDTEYLLKAPVDLVSIRRDCPKGEPLFA